MKPVMIHACCGPCSLEPLRLLMEEGFQPTICWANDNIQPRAEHDLRYETLVRWAQDEGIQVVTAPSDPEVWERCVAPHGFDRQRRCRACYATRLAATCKLAQEMGFTYVSTTLAVSPYQLFDTCSEVLERIARAHGLIPVIRDFRSRYPEATRRSRELGMYRQNYCGCRFSAAEAQAERQIRRDSRKGAKH